MLARELASLGYLRFDAASREYFPSGRLVDLTAWISRSDQTVRRLTALAERVARATGETTSLCSRIGRHLQIEHCVLGSTPGSVVLAPGRAATLDRSIAGRAVLATVDEGDALALIASVPDRKSIIADVRAARRQGYLVGFDLLIAGVGAIALPLPITEPGDCYALAVAAPSPRIRKRQATLIRTCKRLIGDFFKPSERSSTPRRRAHR